MTNSALAIVILLTALVKFVHSMVVKAIKKKGGRGVTEEEKWEGLVEQLLKLDTETLEKLSFEIWSIQMERLFEKAVNEGPKEAVAIGNNVVPFRKKGD